MRFLLKSLLFFFFVLSYGILKSQNIIENTYINEKLALLNSTTSDSLKSVLYNDISEKAALLKFDNKQDQFADSAIYFSKRTEISPLYLRSLTSKINASIVKQDTATVNTLFREGLDLANEKNIQKDNKYFLKFKIREIYFKNRQGKITSKEGLQEFKSIYNEIKTSDKYDIITELVGRISLLYRNRKELGKALNYNNLEIEYAKKSNNPKEVASAKITELDLSYQLIPRPIKSEDVIPLINKAKEAEAYMRENEILDILPFAQLYLAKFYILETSYRKGEYLLNKISDSSSTRIVFSKYEQLCEIAKSTNNLKNYRKYTLKFKPVAYKTKRHFVALNVHNYLIDYFIKSKQKDSASFYAKKLEYNIQQVDTTQFLDYVYFSYDILSAHFFDTDKDKSIQYKDYANRVSQQVVANQKEAFINIIKYREEVENLKNEKANLLSSVGVIKNNLFLIVVIAFLLLVFVFYYFKTYKKSDEKSKMIAERKEEIIKTVERKSIILNNKQKIYLDEIKYIKSERNYVEYYCNDKKMLDRNLLKNVLEQLPPNFIKTHRSYIVNKNHIKVINSNSLVLSPNIVIPISRTFKNNIKTDL